MVVVVVPSVAEMTVTVGAASVVVAVRLVVVVCALGLPLVPPAEVVAIVTVVTVVPELASVAMVVVVIVVGLAAVETVGLVLLSADVAFGVPAGVPQPIPTSLRTQRERVGRRHSVVWELSTSIGTKIDNLTIGI